MKKILQILSVLLLSCLAVVLFGITNQQKAHAATFNNDWLCKWEDDSHVHCSEPTNGSNIAGDLVDALGSGVFGVGGWVSSKLLSDVASGVDATGRKTHEYWYDAARSKAVGVPVFTSNDSPLPEIQFGDIKHPELGLLMTDQNGNTSGSNLGTTTKGDNGPVVIVGNPQAAVNNKKSDVCSVSNSDNCKYAEDVPGHSKGEEYKGGGLSEDTIKTFNASLVSAAAAEEAAKNGGACVDSALSFFLCPINDAIKSALDSTINLLAGVLQTDAPGINNNTAVKNAEQAFVNIANSIYVIVFLLIILANFIAIPGQFFENYTIKKTLPKLIAAIILTQFMFFICIAIMDLTNIAGATIPVAIVSAYKGVSQTLGDAINTAFNPLAQNSPGAAVTTAALDIGYFIFAQIILIIALVVALIGLFYIIFRQFALYVLIIISPLAMAAWVLPGTSKYTKQWFELFIKLCLMYLIVMLIIAFTAIGVDIFKNIAAPTIGVGGAPLAVGPTQVFALLSALLIPLIGLVLIAKSFKWSSKAVAEVGKIASESKAGKAATGQVKGAIKNSAQEGKIAEMKGSAIAGFGKNIGGAKGLKMEARGTKLKQAPSKRLQENLESLGLKRALEESKKDPTGKTDVGKAANRIITDKRRDLANTRNLDAAQMFDAHQLMNPNKDASIIRAEMTRDQGITFDSKGAIITDTNDPNYSPANSVTYNNPYYNGGVGGGAPAGGPAPTPAGGGGGGTPTPTPAPGGGGTAGTPTPGTGAGPGQARSSAAQALRGARAGRAATGSGPAPLSNPNAGPPAPNPAGGPPGGGTPPTPPPAGGPPGFPGP